MFFFKKTKFYEKYSVFLKELELDSANLDKHLQEDLEVFHSCRNKNLFLFISANTILILNNTTMGAFYVSLGGSYQDILFNFLVIFSVESIALLFIEIAVIFYFNHPTVHPLLLGAKRVFIYTTGTLGHAYWLDRWCVSGHFDPPTIFWCARWYQSYRLGCVAHTKSDLLKIAEMRALGYSGPLPVQEGTQNLDRGVLNHMVVLRQEQERVFSEKVTEGVARATKDYTFRTDQFPSESRSEYESRMSMEDGGIASRNPTTPVYPRGLVRFPPEVEGGKTRT